MLSASDDLKLCQKLIQILQGKTSEDNFYKYTVPKLELGVRDQNLTLIYEYVNAIYQTKKAYYQLKIDNDSDQIENIILDLILSIRPKIEGNLLPKKTSHPEKTIKRKTTLSTSTGSN